MPETENKSTATETMNPNDLPAIEGLEVIELLGKGGMSSVYRAKKKGLEQLLAVKVLTTKDLGEAGLARFNREAKNIAEIKHPNIVRVFATGTLSSGAPYLVMEQLQGSSLATVLREKRDTISRAQLAQLMCTVLAGLEYAHRCGLIHRDIKPNNIFLEETPTGIVPKLMDFGFAKCLEEESKKISKTGMISGTPEYMSPEQCLVRDLDFRTDLYSMACVLHECFVGRIPYAGSNGLDLMYKHINATTPSAASLKNSCGAELADLLSATLSKSPEDRPKSASRMRDILEKALSTIPETVAPEPPPKAEKVTKPEKISKQETAAPKPASANERSKDSSAELEAPEKKSAVKTIVIVLGILFFLLLILKDSIIPFFEAPKPLPQSAPKTEP